MSENAPEAPAAGQTEVWHVDFHMSLEPDALAPKYINCEVSHRVPGGEKGKWYMEGLASFDAPDLIVPRVGADLIPYLIYHLDEIKSWLIQEHVTRTFQGIEEKIGDKVGVTSAPTPAWKPVYSD